MKTTQRKAGFTLIELIIVVAILVMMLVVAMPLFFQIIAQRRLTAAVERVATDLRYVQSLAVTRGTVHRLHSGADGAVGRPGQVCMIFLSTKNNNASDDALLYWHPVYTGILFAPPSGGNIEDHRDGQHKSLNNILDGNVYTHQIHTTGKRAHYQGTNQ